MTKTIASLDITEDATDWRQIAAKLMVANLIPTIATDWRQIAAELMIVNSNPTMQPTGGGSPQDQSLLINSRSRDKPAAVLGKAEISCAQLDFGRCDCERVAD
jgi:hypothetical protein